jgi:hypothetical protein
LSKIWIHRQTSARSARSAIHHPCMHLKSEERVTVANSENGTMPRLELWRCALLSWSSVRCVFVFGGLVLNLFSFYMNQFGPLWQNSLSFRDLVVRIKMLPKTCGRTGLRNWVLLSLLLGGNAVMQIFLLYFRGTHIYKKIRAWIKFSLVHMSTTFVLYRE